ncbi:MAG: CbiX/SirB N-terminal domain-containing protein [Rhodospirillales bacterium]
MSTTRSLTPPAPVTDAVAPAANRAYWREAVLIIVTHGSSRCDAVAEVMARHAAALRERRLFADVRTALLHGGPPPQQALAGLQGRPVYVIPVLMCAGRHALETLPKALGLCAGNESAASPPVHLCRPLGLHPALPGLMTARIGEELARRHWLPAQTGVLLAAHGSKMGAASRRAAELQAARLRDQGLFHSVATAFLEEAPLLAGAVRTMAGPLVIVGMFAAPGMHAGQDVSRMLAQCRRADLAYLGAIGADAGIPDIIVELVKAGAADALQPRLS